MKLTTKGRFAVTAMLDLAIQAEESDSPIPIAQVAERQKISLPYLAQTLCRLRRARLVESTRGPGGGSRLAETALSITIDRIILAVDENMDTTQCGGEGTCLGGASCLTHHLWEDLNGVIERFLAGISLASLAAEAEKHPGSGHSAQIPAVIPVRQKEALGPTTSA